MPRIAVAALALMALAVGAADVSAAKERPFKASVGERVKVTVTKFKPGTYALTLVAKDRPARNASCLERIGRRMPVGDSGSTTFEGRIPKRLRCYQGANKWLGRIKTTPGAYRFVIGRRVDKAAWDPKKSFLRRAVKIIE